MIFLKTGAIQTTAVGGSKPGGAYSGRHVQGPNQDNTTTTTCCRVANTKLIRGTFIQQFLGHSDAIVLSSRRNSLISLGCS